MLNFFKAGSILLLSFLFFIYGLSLYASDYADALELQEKCKAESKELEIPIQNFGSQSNKSDFNHGIKLIKLGNIKLTQSKYLDAINYYKEYLQLQFSLYKSLAPVYLNRTQQIIDEIAEDLVDYAENPDMTKHLRLASENLNNSKESETRTFYKQVINSCRTAKKYAIDVYKLVGKDIPKKYLKDQADIDKKIHQETKE